jgi:hypothetical protein
VTILPQDGHVILQNYFFQEVRIEVLDSREADQIAIEFFVLKSCYLSYFLLFIHVHIVALRICPEQLHCQPFFYVTKFFLRKLQWLPRRAHEVFSEYSSFDLDSASVSRCSRLPETTMSLTAGIPLL